MSQKAKLNRTVWRLLEERVAKAYAMRFEEFSVSNSHKSF